MSELVDYSNICKVFAIIILRNDGSRLYSKYYTKMFPK